jgi:hypothetical protein
VTARRKRLEISAAVLILRFGISSFGGLKHVKKLAFAFIGMAAMGVSACGSNNQDTVNNAELNQPASDLNELSSEAANDAANSEAAALGNQQQPVEQNAAAEQNVTNPSDAQEQNVDAM